MALTFENRITSYNVCYTKLLRDEEHGACTMCGEFCAYKVMNERKEMINAH